MGDGLYCHVTAVKRFFSETDNATDAKVLRKKKARISSRVSRKKNHDHILRLINVLNTVMKDFTLLLNSTMKHRNHIIYTVLSSMKTVNHEDISSIQKYLETRRNSDLCSHKDETIETMQDYLKSINNLINYIHADLSESTVYD